MCKWTGWSWDELKATPQDIVQVAIDLINEEQAELERQRQKR